MCNEEILELIERISPHAKDYVDKAFENKRVQVLYSLSTEKNKGVFILVDNDDCCIFYACFYNEDNLGNVLEIINNKVNEYIAAGNLKELCFNVYGNNLKTIQLVRDLGFKSDMEGYHLEYIGKEIPQLETCNLIEKPFKSNMLEEFVDLFNSSYYQLNIDNGWNTNSYSKNKKNFNEKLNYLGKYGQVHSFWLNNELVGAYIFEQNYITDIVVKPTFQNHGYGSYILAHCIRTMNVNKSIKNIRLRVAKSNIGAKRFYERNNFVQIACFAEHTYK